MPTLLDGPAANDDGTPRLIDIFGPPGSGKTTCATTLLEDPTKMLWFSFDLDALIAFKRRGIYIPEFDLSGYNDLQLLRKELEDGVKQTKARVAEKKTWAVCLDTVSTLDKTIVSLLSKVYEGPQLYGAVLAFHRWFLMEQIIPLKIPVIALFHTSFKNLELEKDAKTKRQVANATAGIEAEVDKYIDITGKAGNLWRPQASLIGWMQSAKQPGGKKEYRLHFDGSGGNEYKNRFEDVISGAQPADLRALFTKIKGVSK